MLTMSTSLKCAIQKHFHVTNHPSTSDAAVSLAELFSSVTPETPVSFNPHRHLSQENCDSDLSVTPKTL